MRQEVNSAVEFLSGLLGKSSSIKNLDSSKVDVFSQTLSTVMCTHYQNHWFPEKPFKGSAYRCIRIVNQKMDSLIKQAGERIGLGTSDLLRVFPSELTMWVDPDEVSYRIGEEGSIGVLYDANESSDSDSNSDANSTSSSLPASPVRTPPPVAMGSPVRSPVRSPVVRSLNCSPVSLGTPSSPADMFHSDLFQSQDYFLHHQHDQQQYQQQQQPTYHHQYPPHPQEQHMQGGQDYYPAGCKNEWLRSYLPASSQENANHMPGFESYLSSAFVSS